MNGINLVPQPSRTSVLKLGSGPPAITMRTITARALNRARSDCDSENPAAFEAEYAERGEE